MSKISTKERAEKLTTDLKKAREEGRPFDLREAVEEALNAVHYETWEECFDDNRWLRLGDIVIQPHDVECIDLELTSVGEQSKVRFRHGGKYEEIMAFGVEDTAKLMARLNLVPKK